MMTRLVDLFKRAKRIRQTEGLLALVRQASAFVVRLFFQHQSYYLYETYIHEVLKEGEAKHLPRIKDFTLKIVSTNREADELEAEGLEFRSQVVNAREKLDKGTIAFCIFVGRELAYIGWIAMTEEAMKTAAAPPMKVDFANDEIYALHVWTNPKYRGMGLAPYGDFKTYQFLEEKGKVVHRALVATDNVASVKAWAKLTHPKIYAEARYLKILWWKSWKEKPLT